MRAVVVVPTYQEAGNVEAFLRAVHVHRALGVEVLVVDDNSPDGTSAIAHRVADELGGIRVLDRAGKDGLAAAYRAGFAEALADADVDIVLSMDVDMSHEPAAIPEFLAAIERGADAVIGTRYVRGGRTVNWPWYRRLLSKWGNRYTSRMLRLPLHDVTSGYRAYTASVLRAIDPSSTEAEGYAFLTELAARLVRAGFHVHEHPITFVDRVEGTSKMSGRIIRESMWRVTRWGLQDRFGRRS